MLSPKVADQKPVKKPEMTVKRRDADDLEEFKEKSEKKLKVEGQNKGEKKICIVGVLNQLSPGSTCAEVRTFKDLASALELKDSLLDTFREYGELDNFGDDPDDLIFEGYVRGGTYHIKIKEMAVDDLLEGVDINLELLGQ